MVERTSSTIQSVELGKLPLSEQLAMLIADATGVDPGWLLEGNPAVPPRKGPTIMGTGKGVYGRAEFEFHRAFLESPLASLEEMEVAYVLARESEAAGEKFVPLRLPVRMLAERKEMLEALDRVMVRSLKVVLDQTVTAGVGELIRWKVRRFLQTLAEEHHLSLGQATAPDASETKTTAAHITESQPQTTSKDKTATKPGKPKTKVNFSF